MVGKRKVVGLQRTAIKALRIRLCAQVPMETETWQLYKCPQGLQRLTC